MTLWLILLLVWTAGIPAALFAAAGVVAWRQRPLPEQDDAPLCTEATRIRRHASPFAARRHASLRRR